MAVRALTQLAQGPGYIIFQWTGLTQGSSDTGAPLIVPNWADVSVQLKGTLGVGGECTIQGSNDVSGTITWATLADPQGTALAMSALGIEAILENVYQIRPSITGGDGSTSLTVTVCITTTR